MSIHNLTTGCFIVIDEAVFSGHYRSSNYEGHREIKGTIVAESYGSKRGQHTFTILVSEVSGADSNKYKVGDKVRRKGRNVYGSLTSVAYPENHGELAVEKSSRSGAAKDLREAYRWANGVAS